MESSKGRGSLTSRYLAALLAPAVVAGVMQVTWPFLQYETDLPYLLAVIFCAWYGGLGPGLLSLVISFLLTDFFFTAPYSSFSFSIQVDLVRLPLFAVTGSFICVMSELMHREKRRAGINVDALRESEERYRDLVENSRELICTHDLDGLILSANRAATEVLGHDREDYFGKKNLREILTPEALDGFEDYRARIRNDGVASGIMLVQTSSGDHRVWEYYNTLRTEGVAAPIVRGMARDITERKRNEERLQEYEKVVEGLEEMIVVVDRDYRYLIANRAFLSYRGMKREELLGRFVDEFLSEETFEKVVKEKLEECFRGKVVEYELRYDYPKLGKRDLIISYFPIEGPAGIDRVAVILRDITERKRAEEALRQSEERFSKAFHSSPAALSVTLLEDGRLLEVNDAFLRMTGYQRNEVIGKSTLELGLWFDSNQRINMAGLLRERGTVTDLEFIFRKKSGEVGNGLLSVELIELNGKPCVLGIAQDITERKLAEEALRTAKEFSETLIETANVIIVGLDNSGNINIFNRAAEEITGYTLAQLRGKNWFETLTPKDRFPHVWEEFNRLVAGGIPRLFENPILTKAGEERYILWRNNQVKVHGKIAATISFGNDITERIEAEKALRWAEQKYREIFENAVEGIFQISPGGGYISANPALARMLGFSSPDELIRERSDPAKHRYIDPRRREEYLRLLSEEGVLRDFEYEEYRKDGSRIWLSDNVHDVHDNEGTLLYYEGTTQDITARKLTEEALRESEERYRELFENAKDVTYVHDLSGRYTSVNRAAEKLTGYTRAEILGKEFTHFVPPEQVERIREYFCRKLGDEGETAYESQVITKDGRRVAVEVNSHLILENGLPVGVQGIARDITERKAAEEKLKATSEQLRALSARLQSAREEEGTRIAREIHDELGSALSSLKWDLEGTERILASPMEPSQLAALRERLHALMKLTDVAISAIHRIASELRPSVLDDLGLVAAIEWQAQQFQARTGIVCDCDFSLEKVELTEEQSTAVFRILLEALTNVFRHAKATRVDIRINKENGHFTLSISDNGKGITESEKSEQQSLGILGMGERAHLIGGEIDIKGIAGKGTVVTLRVPILRQAKVFKKAL